MVIRSVNPHDPSDLIGEWEGADSAVVQAAVARAKRAAVVWRATPGAVRATALDRAATALEQRAGEIVALAVREVGKPISEARGEVARAVSILRYYAQAALLPDGETIPAGAPDILMMSRRFPVGVAALVTPWNFPVAIPVWKAAPSLACGNATILKPASAAAGSALLLHEVIARHFPDGVFQVLVGGAAAAEPLIDHPDVGVVSFTGSVEVGNGIIRRVADRGGRAQAEMGGQNPSLVLADADLDRAASSIAYAAMGYAGQKCTATSRVIVEQAVYDAFRDRFVAAVERLRVLDPANADTVVGPVIDARARSAALAAVASAGGRLLSGGIGLDVPGFYVAPTLVELDEPAGPLATEEVFAPVVAVLRASSAEEAIRIANAVRFGLVAAIFTRDLGHVLRLTQEMEVGMVRVNAPTSGVDFQAPFGGSKESSIGSREQGLAALGFYSETRTVTIAP